MSCFSSSETLFNFLTECFDAFYSSANRMARKTARVVQPAPHSPSFGKRIPEVGTAASSERFEKSRSRPPLLGEMGEGHSFYS
jgi:hypothetical protein